MKLVSFIIVISAFRPPLQAQPGIDEAIDLQHLTDAVLPVPDDEINLEDVYENMVQVLSSPHDLNTVTAGELRSLGILSELQLENFLDYRRKQGELVDIHEMQVIDGFDDLTIFRLLPYVKVIDPSSRVNKSLLRRMFSQGNSYLIARYERTIETRQGFKPILGKTSAYKGSPDKLYIRLRSTIPGDFSWGITSEKDAGEKVSFKLRDHQLGLDFTSFHLQLRNKGRIKNIIAGDFQPQFGQGLILGGAFGLGKGGESVATISKSSTGFHPYTSVQESGYRRGLAVSFSAARHVMLSVFYSRAGRDASTEGDDSVTTVSSFQSTGYHRTEAELLARKKVLEQNAGFVVQVDKRQLSAGAIVDMTHFSNPVLRTRNLYNQFAFSGSKNLVTGFFLNYRFHNLSFFNETARSFPGGYGTLTGLLISAQRNLEVALVYRNYTPNFYSFTSNAFSENTQLQNERGVYWGWSYKWNRHLIFSGYVDLFEFPWLSFRRYSPSSGFEWMLRAHYQPSRKTSLRLTYREESKARNTTGITSIYSVEPIIRRNVSFHFDFAPTGSIRMKSRVQYNEQDSPPTTMEGWAFVQDISVSIGRFQLTGRHALFDTDHYDNRHYIYESDAWSAYSLPVYSGVGVRNYALIEFNVTKQLTLWVRYARTLISKGGEIGSGGETIEGKTKNDVKFQARLKF